MSSIVEYFSEHSGYRCGYCKAEDTNYSHGMWGHVLTTQDYQDLIDRGWRRSGQYCYKPTMSKTCCPMYTIKCAALNFKLTKSQKKTLKKFKHFVEEGKIPASFNPTARGDGKENGEAVGSGGEVTVNNSELEKKSKHCESKLNFKNGVNPVPGKSDSNESDSASEVAGGDSASEVAGGDIQAEKAEEEPAPGTTSTSNTVEAAGRMKAKLFRRERWRANRLAKGMDVEPRPPTNSEKSLEEFLTYSTDNTAHSFQTRLVPTEGDAFNESFDESLAVYQKYQVAVHEDALDKCTANQFRRFLCKSPLMKDGRLGSFHRHYLIDGKIVAVGVIDILPNCISSVYLYYDPDFSFLSLGTYTSLSEIALVRELSRQVSAHLQFYYLGFYIHSCPKMRYKGQYSPSFLSCPETYSWNPIVACSARLDTAPYARLEPDTAKRDPGHFSDVNDVKVLFSRQMMDWEVYRSLTCSEDETPEDLSEVMEYGRLVGKKLASRMLLFRAN